MVSWVAINNDPFERISPDGDYRFVDGQPIPGPTLTALLDPDSSVAKRIRDVVLLHQNTASASKRERRAVQQTRKALSDLAPKLRVHNLTWQGGDPTDHLAIFEFLREALPTLRHRFSTRELVVHISPGTPSMQTIWVLMAETGFIEPPFLLVKSYRKGERPGQAAVVPVNLGIETFYKAYKAARPRQFASEDQGVVWESGIHRDSARRGCDVYSKKHVDSQP